MTDGNGASKSTKIIEPWAETERSQRCATLSDWSINVDLARLWIGHCLQNHKVCKLGSPKYLQRKNPLPALLIDVTTPSRPFLEPRTATTTGPYLALSYCWGKQGNLRTLRERYDIYRKLIPVEELPRTVKDAIDVTRLLGCQYLWVDALCIVQDDEEIRQRELSKMGDVYRNALPTICAERESCNDGLFEARDPRLRRPLQVTWSRTTTEGNAMTEVTLTATWYGINHLERRGWALQEEVLSPRRLIFGEQMSWACAVSTAREASPVPKDGKFPLRNERANKLSKLRMWLFAADMMRGANRASLRRDNHFDAWYTIVEESSERNLTLLTDNLPALSGPAAQFAQGHAVTYFAGLWREDLQTGLTWYVAGNHRFWGPTMEDPTNTEPIWSGASVGKMRIQFMTTELQAIHFQLSQGAEIPTAPYVPPFEHSPYGRVIHGSLVLRGLIKKVVVQWRQAFPWININWPIVLECKNSLTAKPIKYARFRGRILDSKTREIIRLAALDRLAQVRATASCVPPSYAPLKTTEEWLERQAWCFLLNEFMQSYEGGVLALNTYLVLDQINDLRSVFRCGLAVLENAAWSPTGTLDRTNTDSVERDSVRTVTIV